MRPVLNTAVVPVATAHMLVALGETLHADLVPESLSGATALG